MAELSGTIAVCHHCNKRRLTVELCEETYEQIDYYGVESLPEVDQAVYEGISICKQCYEKEGGFI